MASNGSVQLSSGLRASFGRSQKSEAQTQLEAMSEKLLPPTRVTGLRLFTQQVRVA